MQPYVNKSISTLSDLLPHYVVIQWCLGWKYDNLFISCYYLWLFYLLLNDFSYYRLWLWHDGPKGVWFQNDVIDVGLPSLNDRSFDIADTGVGLGGRSIYVVCLIYSWIYSVLSRRCLLGTWWLKEEVVDDHLRLIHVHWSSDYHAGLSSSARSTGLLCKYHLLLIKILNVLLWILMLIVKTIDSDRLRLVELQDIMFPLFSLLGTIAHVDNWWICSRSIRWY